MSHSTQNQWSKPGIIDFETSADGLEIFRIHTGSITARFAIQGAHLIDFTNNENIPLLFISRQSLFAPGKAIRGGIPVIFPWFGPREGHPESPMHGLVRTRPWQISEITIHPDGTAKVGFSFNDSPETLALWPHAFELKLEFTLGRELEVRWEVRNSGQNAFRFEQALHPYFPVQDVLRANVQGLAGATYIDKTDSLKLKEEGADAIVFSGETDRLYLDTTSTCILEDQAAGRRLTISKTGAGSSVVWNPWITKAAALSDMADDEWKEFVCVEQANANRNAIELKSGETHVFSARYAPTSVGI